MNRLRFYSGVGIFIAMIAVLLALGLWQLERLQWKRSLLNDRLAAQSLPPQRWSSGDRLPILYSRVILSGHFIAGTESRWLGRFDGEQSGIALLQAFQIEAKGKSKGSDNKNQNSIIWVNRGFIANGAIGEIAAIPVLTAERPIEVSGWLMPRPTPGRFTPQNIPEQNLWYWPDLTSLCQKNLSVDPCLNDHYLLLQAESQAESQAELPPDSLVVTSDKIKIVKNLPELVNNHLQYAITWFSLALILVVVFGILIRRGFRR